MEAHKPPQESQPLGGLIGQTRFNRPRLSLAKEVKEKHEGRGMHFNCFDVIVEAIQTFYKFDIYLTFLMDIHRDICKTGSREGF